MKSCKLVYTSIGYGIKAVEEALHVPFLPIHLILFGQPVPANKDCQKDFQFIFLIYFFNERTRFLHFY